MSELSLRALGEDEFDAFAEMLSFAFSDRLDPAEMMHDRRLFEPARSLGAFEGEELVGATAAYSIRLTVPGAVLPTAGVTAVGVAPTHRRRGFLSAMMRRQLSDVRERGEPLAALWASESSIYGRYGYGAAAMVAETEIERAATAFLPEVGEPRGRVRRVAGEELPKLAGPVHDRVRPTRPGMIERSATWWGHILSDPESHRDGFSPLFHVVHEDEDGRCDGYAFYRFKHDWPNEVARGVLRLEEILGETAEAELALWRFCFGVDLAATIRCWNRPVDDVLQHALLDPRRLRTTVRDGLWVRVVDVPSALAGRRYATQGELTLEVVDDWEPGWGGVFRLEGGPEGASCEAVSAEPELRISARDLGSVYLGGPRFGPLARAGRVEELVPGAVRRADLLFAWDPAPWCPETF